MKYGVWCRVSGGVTGTREAWLKDADGNVMVFDDESAAAKAASDLQRLRDARQYRSADFSYRAQPLDGSM